MTKFSKFAYIAGTASAVTAGSWMMAFWGRNHGGHAYVQDYAYMATARAERRALCGLVGPTNEAFTMPLDFTNGNMATSVSNAWTNLVVHLPVHRAAYLTKDNILDDDALARSGAWVVPEVWPEDGSALETTAQAFADGYGRIGGITNFPETAHVTNSPYVHAWVPKAATNIYPRMQYLMAQAAGYYCPSGRLDRAWRGRFSTSSYPDPIAEVNVASYVVQAWSIASTNVIFNFDDAVSTDPDMEIYWKQEYLEMTGPTNTFNAGADLELRWPKGPIGVALDMAPRFWRPESGQCVVSNAWLVMSAEVYGNASVETNNFVAADTEAFLGMLEEEGEGRFDASGLTLEMGGFQGIATTNYYRTYLVPLAMTEPGDALYPLWKWTPPPVPLGLLSAQGEAIFGTFPRDASEVYADPYFSAACRPVAVLLQGDFETYHASTNTWSDCDYYEPAP